MRDVLDCGVLLAPGHESAMNAWVSVHQARLARVRLHPVSLAPLPQGAARDRAALPADSPHSDSPRTESPAADALGRLAVALRRYDGCILPVAPGSLAWARMALQQAGAALTTPILLLVHDVKAPGILDLLTLGAADFIAHPVCLESLRVRLYRLARPAAPRAAAPAAAVHERHASYLGARPDAAGARPPAASRPRVGHDVVDDALANLRHQYRRTSHDSFRTAKAQVVNGFEREYIRQALSRHGGNVAQAARACAKHRRAFWALMRKHGIEAAPYRQAALAAGCRNAEG